MADRSSTLLISALTRAATDPSGVPLHGTKTTSGLFPSTALGRQAALRSCEEGYLTPVENSADGKSSPRCTISEKGLTYLLEQVSPRQVLEDCVRILEQRECQLGQLLQSARQMQSGLESLRGTLTSVLQRLGSPTGELKALFARFHGEKEPDSADLGLQILSTLQRWERSGAQDDCPLSELFRHVAASFTTDLTIGQFHDVMRQLHDSHQVYLHPWTGPLYEIPEPSYSLLVGHEIAYYASLRRKDEG